MAPKLLRWENSTFYISDSVYEPAEDTFLLAGNLGVERGDIVLDMGTGCGILGILAASKAERVVAVDVNPYAVRCAKVNSKVNKVYHKIELLRGDLFGPVKGDEIFDLILFNAPYLPTEKNELNDWIDWAWAAGEDGRAVIDRFIVSATGYLKRGGHILLVQSSLSDVNKTLHKLNTQGLETVVLSEKKAHFETITLIRARKRGD